ncbi:MAG: prepilin-type N-terminal cleavage/methylation domain-containing protein [Methylococcaceae bacterium]|nr:prepilin-type N-terminal cleavage/methylation domain-containing protein [Methylococcaceae bacterium]
MHNHLKNTRGFTLLELMITLSIAIVLTTIAIPSFMSLIRDSRMTANANDLLTTLNYARSEAITRNVQVTIKNKGEDKTEWAEGWTVFVDYDGNGDCDDGCDATNAGEDELLKTHASFHNGYTLVSGDNVEEWLAYKPTGLSKGSGGLSTNSFKLCHDEDTDSARKIVLNNVGRAKVEAGTACS